MKREEFINSIIGQLRKYLYLSDEFGTNAQIRVNPALLYVDLLSDKQYLQAIGFSDEVIENAAYAEGDETMSSDDYQATQDPDFYPVSTLLKKDAAGDLEPDYDAVNKVADKYFD